LKEAEAGKQILELATGLVKDELDLVEDEIRKRFRSKVPLIRNVASYLLEGGGKRIRPALHLLSFRLCNGKGNRAIPVAAALEFLHNATLLHDDVVDGADLRRGKQAANLRYGNQQSVLTGDFLVTRVFGILVEDGDLDLLSLIADITARMAEGEALELSLTSSDVPDEKHYLEVISEKTAVLFAASCEAAAILAGVKEARKPLWEYGMGFGMAFQLVDDLLDYLGTKDMLGKPVGGDLAEGKLTLPLLLAFKKSGNEAKALLDRMVFGEIREDDITLAANLIKNTGAHEITLRRAKDYSRKAIESIATLPASRERTALKDLARFCTDRNF